MSNREKIQQIIYDYIVQQSYAYGGNLYVHEYPGRNLVDVDGKIDTTELANKIGEELGI